MDTTPKVGETLTTSKSDITGIVQEVVEHATTPGLFRVRILVDGGTPDAFEKWTMVKVTA
jgi:hypothetical protein